MTTCGRLALVALAAGLATGVATGREARTNAFKTALSLGLNLTDGNSETMQLNAALTTEGEKAGLGSLRAGGEANYGESTVAERSETTIENARLFANIKKNLGARGFASLDGAVLYDDIALIDYRATLGPGLGVFLVKNDRATLSVEAGPSYVWEKVAGATDDYLAMRFGQRLAVPLSATAKIWQSLDYLPTVDDFDAYLLTGEIGIEAKMTTRLGLRVVLQDKFDSLPAAGQEKNDLTLIAGISLAL